jgi:hypothetical protein
MKTILTTLIIGAALTLVACGKDKKAATADPQPTAAEPAKADPNAPAADPNAEAKPAAPAQAAPTGW